MKSISIRRPLAMLTVALILVASPAWAVDATFSGRVFEADGLTLSQQGLEIRLDTPLTSRLLLCEATD